MVVAVAYDSHAGEEKRTKPETTRLVPVHPALAEILGRVEDGPNWERIYGREPTGDDLVVPTGR